MGEVIKPTKGDEALVGIKIGDNHLGLRLKNSRISSLNTATKIAMIVKMILESIFLVSFLQNPTPVPKDQKKTQSLVRIGHFAKKATLIFKTPSSHQKLGA
ncbi:hypothetical protein BKH46_08745 [Helicobacter sp. 12S02634-8]|nr:hypothetical protein BKH46_08745 [Helicobacter sp. 12S02634-8]